MTAAARPRVPTPIPTLFFGSGPFALPILDAVADMPKLALVGVVGAPDRPSGRGRRVASPPAIERARELGLDVRQPPTLRDPAVRESLAGLRPELAILADYGRLVPQAILDLPTRGFLNLHPSLLPRHRGATPIAATILAGDAEAGVSLFEMDAGLDSGPVVAMTSWPLRGDETAPQLESEAAARAAGLLRAVLPDWLAGRRTATPQDGRLATMTRPFSREDGRLDPSRPAGDLERRVRALAPWPGTFVDTSIGRLAVREAAATTGSPATTTSGPGGELIADGDGLALVTSAGLLRLQVVRLAAGRAMTGAELRRGHRELVGARIA